MSLHVITGLVALAAGVLLLARQGARGLRRTRRGFGWDCPACRITAGHPDNPFPDRDAASEAFRLHIECTHLGQMPAGASVAEIAWH